MQKILFICLGNICRSPTAEAIFIKMLKEQKLDHLVIVDSAGTSGYHQGELPDSRMRTHAQKRNYELLSRSRQLLKEDLEEFDLILGMDDSNIANIKKLDPQGNYTNKIQKLTDFRSKTKMDFVPDPYFGGDDGFELVLDILEDCCQQLINQVVKK